MIFKGGFIIDELKTLQIAALLHDIGKFYLRTSLPHDDKYKDLKKDDFGGFGAHSKWSASFIGDIYGEIEGGKIIEDLVLYHHKKTNSKYENLINIIKISDEHSSKERDKRENDETSRDVNKEPLISIFSKIQLSKDNDTKECYFPIEKLTLNQKSFDTLRPVPSKKVSLDYKTLWYDFKRDFSKLNDRNKADFNTILAILKKYTSTMPSAAYVDNPDISLYDHSKTTAAIATCRFQFHKDGNEKLKQTDNQKVYLVINGDISGIQKFIYRISSPQEAQSGMSKRLRGRSIYINLLNDAIANRIVEELGLTKANLLFCGGGRFTILGSNTRKTIEKLEEIKKEINDLFISQFNAELYFATAYKEVSGKDKDTNIDLENFGEITRILADKLAEDKKHKFSNALKSLFKIKEVTYENQCSVCGKLTPNEKICDSCKSHEDLGKKVTNAKYMIKCLICKDKNKKDFDFYEKPLKTAYLFIESKNKLIEIVNKIAIDFKKIEISRINSTDFTDAEIIKEIKADNVSYNFEFLGNTVPMYYGKDDNGNDLKTLPLYFEHLAKISKGANKLGILKMDVDNLGKIFSEGLKYEEKDENENIIKDVNGNPKRINKSSISRISTLSSQLDMFFSGFINEISKEYKVFSEVCESCEEKTKPIKLYIQNDDKNEKEDKETLINSKKESFTVYRQNNESEKLCEECLEKTIPTIYINYSGGDDLLVLGPYDHIMEFARNLREKFKMWTCDNLDISLSAGINIVDSKFPIGKAAITSDEYLEASKNCGEDKDKITVFNEVVKWEDNGSCKGYYELLEFANDLEDYVKMGDNGISRGLIYSMLRMWQNTFISSDELFTNEKDWKKDISKRLSKKNYIPQFKYKLRLIKNKNIRNELDKKGIKFMPWIKIPVSWASLRTR